MFQNQKEMFSSLMNHSHFITKIYPMKRLKNINVCSFLSLSWFNCPSHSSWLNKKQSNTLIKYSKSKSRSIVFYSLIKKCSFTSFHYRSTSFHSYKHNWGHDNRIEIQHHDKKSILYAEWDSEEHNTKMFYFLGRSLLSLRCRDVVNNKQ